MEQSRAAHVERREVHYRGQVQGVGFRYRTRQIAERFPVTGYVRNLPDGRVELVVEGNGATLDRFLGEVAAQLAEHIRSADEDVRPGSGQFQGFEIRH